MNKEVELFLKEYNQLIRDSQKFCYISRGKEFQQEAIQKLKKLKQKAITLKEQMIELEDENHANIMLSLENLIDAIINELEMWITLKEDNPNKAWDFLINAQCAIRTSLQAHSIALDLNGEGYTEKLHLMEKLLFPPQMFFSIGFIIENAECSICGKEYGECEHVVGKAYMGKMCYKIITKCELKETSIVEEPSNKQARTYQITDNGITRDFMTWREVKKNELNHNIK